jgi:uncharacterized protein (TIGR03437 family)
LRIKLHALRYCRASCFLLSALSASAQLIPAGQPVPRTAKLPVVFLNGYQRDCTNASFADTFGIADQVVQSNGQISLFFNNCSAPGSPDIEGLGAAFGVFLSTLRYEDGQPVDLVDCVMHSMGGLIVRSYLSGKQSAAGVFSPPAVTHIRKALFLATPHFGTGVAAAFALDAQSRELTSGSRFLSDLATWNQGTDDLRGVDAVTAIGNGGTGLATLPGFDDGIVTLTSASLGFYRPGRTRVVPYCHVEGGGLISFVGYCSFSAPGIARIRSATQDAARIMVSFLNGTTDWMSVGAAAEQNPFLSAVGGLYVTIRSADDMSLQIDSVKAGLFGQTKDLNILSGDVAYTDLFPAGPATLTAAAGSVHVSQSITLPAGAVAPVVLKPGPSINRVFPAASSVFPLSVAPGMVTAIYGTSLAAQTAHALTVPLPLQLSDAQVLVGGAPVPLYSVSPGQINAVLPEGLSGLVKLTVRNAAGSHTVNVWVEPAVPAIFTQDGSGKGAAAALNARTYSLVSPANPLHGGDYLALFLTGLGSTSNRDGLNFANQLPAVTIAGKDCPVIFAGRAPGFPGLDQINCLVPPGLAADSAAPVVVSSGNRTSNVAAIAVQ